MTAVLAPDQLWYLHEDDCIGGWSIMNVDKPPSQCDYKMGEHSIATFVNEDYAKEIVKLHNDRYNT